ncbi:MAG TPA: flagellar motor switch protein FliN [Phycisphaerales bacterium]|nr:flagellar motor switch protein FliN [Phycisphaerales bacterium]HRQ74453.1 flagellar motor switch protein FliN [Phycisphaerales bacterium]
MAEQSPDIQAQQQTGDDPAPEVLAEQSINAAAAAAEKIKGAAGEVALDLPDFARANGTAGRNGAAGLSLLDDIDLDVKIELGRTRMYVEDVLRLNAESVIELDKAAGDPVDIYVNDRHVARGEVLVLNENFCVRISEIIKQPSAEASSS